MIILLLLFNSLCVWRYPDRDLKDIFHADSYQTVYFDVSREDQTDIEKKLGRPLDSDETEFKFYPVFRQGREIGAISTHLSKGQYGAIEVLVAFEYGTDRTKFKVKAVRIQRDREKARASLRSEKFLGQFVGKTLADSLKVGFDIKPASAGSEKSSAAIAFAIRKLLIVFSKVAVRK